jgi:hypothetical protein
MQDLESGRPTKIRKFITLTLTDTKITTVHSQTKYFSKGFNFKYNLIRGRPGDFGKYRR